MPPHISGDEEFDGFFAREVLPWLEEEEQKRRVLADMARRNGLITVGVTFVAAIVALYFRMPVGALVLIMVLGGLTGFASGFRLYLWAGSFNEALAKKVFGHFGFQYSAKSTVQFLKRFSGIGLLPSYDRYELTDEVSGKIDGMDIHLVEANLSRRTRTKNGSTRTIVFHGLLVSATFSKPFSGRTLIKTDKGAISHFLEDIFGNDAAVRLEDPAFEAEFDVYSNDQIEARTLLTPAFMERLLTLRRKMDGPVRSAFYQGQFWLAIDGRRDYFPAYSSWQDVRDPDQARNLVRDISLISSVLRLLKLDSGTRV
tara:strand:- start:27198 stop:28136 length:939 start_codon:yes stop_codon:yes gene_type:complete